MEQELENAHFAITGVLAMFSTVLGFFGVRLINQVDENTKELSKHKEDDAQRYATTDTVDKALERIHERIDNMADDIKTLIGRH